MAFKFPEDSKRIPFYKKGSVDRKPPFRATGRGLMVDKPSFKATEYNANAVLTATIQAPVGAAYLEKFYLFVTRVATGWTLSGEHGQTLSSRAFYPRNLSQTDLVIEGICPSQHEYDKLVEFVQAHHLRIVGMEAAQETFETPNQTNSVNFRMARPGNRANTYRHAPRIDWDVAITSVSSGHERFVFAPTFQLTCKVLNDKLQPAADVEFDIMRDLDYAQVFGDMFNPLPQGAIQITGQLPHNTQLKRLLNTSGAGGGGGGGRGGLDQSPGSPPDPAWAGPIAAAAEALSNPAAGDPIKKQFSGCIPPDPGRQYMAYDGISKGNGPHGVEIVDGNKIRVKYRDPPGAGNTIHVTVPL
jgi:hypothetical protein